MNMNEVSWPPSWRKNNKCCKNSNLWLEQSSFTRSENKLMKVKPASLGAEHRVEIVLQHPFIVFKPSLHPWTQPDARKRGENWEYCCCKDLVCEETKQAGVVLLRTKQGVFSTAWPTLKIIRYFSIRHPGVTKYLLFDTIVDHLKINF